MRANNLCFTVLSVGMDRSHTVHLPSSEQSMKQMMNCDAFLWSAQ